MKRSEMVEILRQSYITHINETCCQNDDEFYSHILSDLEKAGIHPPEYINGNFRVLDWEPEDLVYNKSN